MTDPNVLPPYAPEDVRLVQRFHEATVLAELEAHLAALEAWADHLPHHAECATFWGWSAKPTPACDCYLSRRPKMS